MVVYRIYKYINGEWVKTSYASTDRKLIKRIARSLQQAKVLFDIRQEKIDVFYKKV